MRRPGIHLAVWLGVLCALFATSTWIACVAHPVNPGYVSVAAGAPHGVDLSISGGGGVEIFEDTEVVAVGAGSIHVEPYASSRLSIPLSISAGGSDMDGFRAWGGAGRIGIRYRLLSWLAIGSGVGVGLFRGEMRWFGEVLINEHEKWASFFDIELAAGIRKGRWGFSLALRPTFEAIEALFTLPVEAVVGIHPSRSLAITIHVYGGYWNDIDGNGLEYGGWIAGGLGLMIQFPVKKPLDKNEDI